MKLLVTGGAGYIGSHMVRLLVESGHSCVVIDNLSTGHRWAIDSRAEFVQADIADSEQVISLLRSHSIDAVLHFAAKIVVPESVREPLLYYRSNSMKTLALLEACAAAGVDKFVFSSTAAIYGKGRDDGTPIQESDALAPINPYGHSKLVTERILADLAATAAMRYVSLRYFNVAGAQPDATLGQATPEATHLIKTACEVATGKRENMSIFGTDYPTADGTCIRDYIHVVDLVRVHLLALDYLAGGGVSDVFNCGYGHGSSVREVVELVRRVSGIDFTIRESARRAGDSPALIADSTKAQKTFGWKPDYDDLETIITHAWQWEQKLATTGNP